MGRAPRARAGQDDAGLARGLVLPVRGHALAVLDGEAEPGHLAEQHAEERAADLGRRHKGALARPPVLLVVERGDRGAVDVLAAVPLVAHGRVHLLALELGLHLGPVPEHRHGGRLDDDDVAWACGQWKRGKGGAGMGHGALPV